MITRIDTLSYTLPLSYFMEQVFELKAASMRKLHESVAVLPASKEYKTIIAQESGVWRSFSELVETKAHNYKDGYEAAVVWCVESMLNDHLGLDVEVAQSLRNGRNNFQYSVNFEGGFVAFGGNNRILSPEGGMVEIPERMQIYLSGECCQRLTYAQWKGLYQWSTTVEDLKITRADVCLDDMEGVFELDYFEEQFDSGAFESGRGRPPELTHFRKKVRGAAQTSGESMYVGSRKSGKLVRGYEKGKQLGDPESRWVRTEVEFGSKDRVIPLNILVQPDAYFGGAYPYCAALLSYFEAEHSDKTTDIQSIKTLKKKTKIEYEHLKNHARRAYGRLVNFMTNNLGLDPVTIVKELSPDDTSLLPSRLSYRGLDSFRILGPLYEI